MVSVQPELVSLPAPAVLPSVPAVEKSIRIGDSQEEPSPLIRQASGPSCTVPSSQAQSGVPVSSAQVPWSEQV